MYLSHTAATVSFSGQTATILAGKDLADPSQKFVKKELLISNEKGNALHLFGKGAPLYTPIRSPMSLKSC